MEIGSAGSGIALQQAVERQNFALSSIKRTAESERSIATVLEQGAQSASNASRGSNVDILV